MRRLATIFTGLGLLAGVACAGRAAGSLGPAPTGASPTGSPSPSPSASPSGSPSASPGPTKTPGRTVTFEVWFLSHGHLFVTKRTEPFTPAVAKLALDALTAGPSQVEERAGVATSLPAGVTGSIAGLTGGKVTVDFGPPFYAERDSIVRLRQAQVVYTLTQYSTISRVAFSENGRPAGSKAWTRNDFADLLPLILVESPIIGQRVGNPVTVSGIANVFEATVSLRILDENGREVASTFTTATCGTGCWGDYSVSVPYSVDHEQPGIVEVYESFARDGSRINVDDIPVTLTP